jgi:hypothetical protein
MNTLLKWDPVKAEKTAQRYFAHVKELRDQRRALESLITDAEEAQGETEKTESPHVPAFRWTIEALKRDALSYSSKTQWQKSNPPAYQTAWARGVLGECCGHMKRPRKWTAEAVEFDARRFKTRGRWAKLSPSAYHAARRLNLVDHCCRHMSSVGARRPTLPIFNTRTRGIADK